MDKRNALIAAVQAGAVREIAEIKNNGASNRFMSATDRLKRSKRNRTAKQSRRANRG